mgnify:CR=1 FL=1
MLTAAGQSDSVKAAASTRLGEGKADYNAVGNDGEGALDHVDAINQVFAEFEFAYHNQYHKAFPSAESLAIAKKYWMSSLQHFPPAHIVMAVKRVVRSQEYLPSISVLLRACEEGHELFGLPKPRRAYFEACSAPSPKRDNDWSHEAVYHAGRATGWYLLANEPESVAFPQFEYQYQHYCRLVMTGQELSVEASPALRKKPEQPLDAKETRARLAKLRTELKL